MSERPGRETELKGLIGFSNGFLMRILRLVLYTGGGPMGSLWEPFAGPERQNRTRCREGVES